KAIHETMAGLKQQSSFETFDRMAQKIDQMEAEADASAEIAEEYTGDQLAHKFDKLEQTAGADDDLAALKQKMGLAPPAPPPAAAAPPVRVAAPAAGAPAAAAEKEPELSQAEQDELVAALAELEASENQQKKMSK
ncbi:MAG: PspA/IM30 family protein, partial [Myxococcales bacterium]|nr:PspA/IM30 family protein [Myxococcales bacterium]